MACISILYTNKIITTLKLSNIFTFIFICYRECVRNI